MAKPTREPVGRVIVLIPTYNERENLPRIIGRLRAAVPTADVLVLDDGSPDGTGAIADELAAADQHLHVLHRTSKQGLGGAYLAGFEWGLRRGYDVLVEMDADGSHQPEQLRALLVAALADADVVIGARGGCAAGRRRQLARPPEGAQRSGPTSTRKVLLGMPRRRRDGRVPRLPVVRGPAAASTFPPCRSRRATASRST